MFPPGPVKVNVEVLIVAGFIASLNVAVMTGVFGQTRVKPASGVTAITVGGGIGGGHAMAVVNIQTKLAATILPNESAAPVVIVAVKAVPTARVFVGVNVAIWLVAS